VTGWRLKTVTVVYRNLLISEYGEVYTRQANPEEENGTGRSSCDMSWEGRLVEE
jgi:hypothetical protein